MSLTSGRQGPMPAPASGPAAVGAADARGTPRRIRVAFCIDGMGIGGTELNAVRTAERLDRTRFEVLVVTQRADGPLRARYAAAGIEVHEFPLRSLGSPHTLRQAWRLARFLRARGIDVVHAHDAYNNVFAVLAGRLARVRGIVASRRWYVPPNRGRALRAANALAYRFAHRVLANSAAVGAMVAREEGVRASRIAVIENFVDDSAFASPDASTRCAWRAELGIAPDAPLVGVVARLDPMKDHASLVAALPGLLRRHPTLRCVFVGDGPARAALEADVFARGLGAVVVFAGQRPHTPGASHFLDVAVLPSTSEGFPNAVVEAMAAARPVVATRVGGTPDAVVDGETGLLVPPGDPEALGAALATLLADPVRGRQMGLAGAMVARLRYAATAVVPRLEDLYRALAGAPVA